MLAEATRGELVGERVRAAVELRECERAIVVDDRRLVAPRDGVHRDRRGDADSPVAERKPHPEQAIRPHRSHEAALSQHEGCLDLARERKPHGENDMQSACAASAFATVRVGWDSPARQRTGYASPWWQE